MNKSTPGLDPKDILRHAMAFQHSAQRLSKRQPGDDEIWPLFAHPYMVLVALSAELYLKCLYCIDSADTPWGHHLKVLFDGLPTMRRDRIAYHWNQINALPDNARRRKQIIDTGGWPIPSDLPTILQECGDAFEVIRYVYEHQNKAKFFGVDALPEAIWHTIIEIHPDLASLSFPGIKKLGP